ncbi:hypothetical protein N656DRAFT_474656 [Canariomyces notabilis]|uniref:Uncharacterized protein n=1 Tax=Canariomyces notabilis TaxID=2074819 RepID=A0AAN6TJC2_9PEZI|nr:hypothetical protein N656DRAFT_474656 [Canariomyces arenarius]
MRCKQLFRFRLSLHSLFAAGARSQGLEEGPTAVVSHTDLMNEEGLIFLGSLFFCSVALFRGRSGVPSREMAAQSQKPPTGTHARTVIRLKSVRTRRTRPTRAQRRLWLGEKTRRVTECFYPAATLTPLECLECASAGFFSAQRDYPIVNRSRRAGFPSSPPKWNCLPG